MIQVCREVKMCMMEKVYLILGTLGYIFNNGTNDVKYCVTKQIRLGFV